MNIPISLQYSNPFYISQLHNGITICTEYIAHSLLNCIGVYVNSGSRFESPNASGSAHFLEHILFKGTRHQTKTQFEYDIEQRGSSINAYTSREHTLYSIDCFTNEVKHSLQTLSHMIMYPTISSHAIENEKETITEELIHCYKDKIQWENIVAISASYDYTAGLRADGTVVTTEITLDDHDTGQTNVRNWKDIVAISAGVMHMVGVKADGTVIAIGSNKYNNCEVSGWNVFK